MAKVDRVTITVTVEGEADEGERAFARLFDKYMTIYRAKWEHEAARSGALTCDRALSPSGGRR